MCDTHNNFDFYVFTTYHSGETDGVDEHRSQIRENLGLNQFLGRVRDATIHSELRRLYTYIKPEPSFEELSRNQNISIPLLNFKTCNHRIPVETGRWKKNLVEDELCTSSEVGDEYPYLFKCELLDTSLNIIMSSPVQKLW